jgi:hypothetical protein
LLPERLVDEGGVNNSWKEHLVCCWVRWFRRVSDVEVWNLDFSLPSL